MRTSIKIQKESQGYSGCGFGPILRCSSSWSTHFARHSTSTATEKKTQEEVNNEKEKGDARVLLVGNHSPPVNAPPPKKGFFSFLDKDHIIADPNYNR